MTLLTASEREYINKITFEKNYLRIEIMFEEVLPAISNVENDTGIRACSSQLVSEFLTTFSKSSPHGIIKIPPI